MWNLLESHPVKRLIGVLVDLRYLEQWMYDAHHPALVLLPIELDEPDETMKMDLKMMLLGLKAIYVAK